MRINLLSHTKAALDGAPSIAPEDRAETVDNVARQILADLLAEAADYVTRTEEPLVVELETEKAAAEGVDLSTRYMRILGLYAAAYFSDGYLSLVQSFDLPM